MNEIDSSIQNINKVICSNIDKFSITERGLLSQNIISQLRNFVEHISLKVFSNGQNIEVTYPNIERAITFVRSRGSFKFLNPLAKVIIKYKFW